jgi:phosphoribosylanthranilate isomerase
MQQARKPMSIKTKISGITTKEALNICIKYRVDYIGMVFYENSPCNLSFRYAKEFAGIIPHTTKKVAVVVNPDLQLIKNIQSSFAPDYFQLDDGESPERLASLKCRYKLNIIKTIRLGSKFDEALIKSYDPYVDGYLFEAKANDNLYADQTENIFDWGLLNGFHTSKFWMLSGGINKFNVREAIRASGAKIVNASSTLENSPGIKDESILDEFLRLTRSL